MGGDTSGSFGLGGGEGSLAGGDTSGSFGIRRGGGGGDFGAGRDTSGSFGSSSATALTSNVALTSPRFALNASQYTLRHPTLSKSIPERTSARKLEPLTRRSGISSLLNRPPRAIDLLEHSSAHHMYTCGARPSYVKSEIYAWMGVSVSERASERASVRACESEPGATYRNSTILGD